MTSIYIYILFHCVTLHDSCLVYNTVLEAFALDHGVGVMFYFSNFTVLFAQRGAVAQSVERATPGEEVSSSIPSAAAHSLLVGSVSV